MTTVSGYAKIIVTLQRKEVDDVLTIIPDMDSDGYYVTFDQRSVKNRTCRYFGNSILADYIRTFFQTILSDTDLPAHVQIDCPMFPTVILPPFHLEGYFPLLEKQIDTLQDDWPYETAP